MKIKDRPLDEDDLAIADLAEVADWTKVAGPESDAPGYETVKAIVHRVSAATGWKPWPRRQPERELRPDGVVGVRDLARHDR